MLGLLLVVGCSSPAPSNDSGDQEKSTDGAACIGPENPYDDGTGHHAGYDWAEKQGSGECSGNSQSFNEGCEEYETQESDYQTCESQRKK
jgi:hypothetical protein